MKYKNVTIIGTSHIAIQSIKEVKSFIKKNQPDIITLELDKRRLAGLFQKRKLRLTDIKYLGVKAFLFNLIGSYIEQKLGKLVGVSPGAEMKTAVQEGSKYHAKIYLIDQDIKLTIKKLFKQITLREKLRFIVDILKSFIIKKNIKFDLRKVPSKEIIKKLLNEVKKSYPSVYKVLIKNRNIYMARRLKTIMQSHKDERILAIMGAGHEDEIIKIIKRS